MSIYREISEAGARGMRKYGSGVARNAKGRFTKGVNARPVNWIKPHKNQEVLNYKGYTITLAQQVSDGTWSWDVQSEEDGGGYSSKSQALAAAKDMAESMARE